MSVKESILKIKQSNILLIGDSMIDRYYKGSCSRISPEAPIPVFLYQNQYDILGGAANVANNLIKAGQNVYLSTVVGDDQDGKILTKQLESHNINTNLVVVEENRKTTTKTRFQGQNNHQMFRFDYEDIHPISNSTCNNILSSVQKVISNIDIVLISDYQKGMLSKELIKKIIDICKKNNIRVIVDVKSKDASIYQNAWLLKPNISELFALTNMDVSTEKNIEYASQRLREIANVEYVLVTRGGDGMSLAGDFGVKHFKCESRDVYDVTGAGDTVLSYLGVGLSSGLSIEDAIEIANIAAGVKVSHIGTYAVTIDDIRDYINIEVDYMNKIVSADKIKEILKTKKKIVFTNGCFDILHAGHLKYLFEASKIGDLLVVGLNSDFSVKKIKGNDRPINSENDRAALLAGLSCVDYVIIFEEETPYELIKKINPLYIVKGGDYKVDEVVGKDIALKNGGGVILIDLVNGKSTTNIIKKIEELNKNEKRDNRKN